MPLIDYREARALLRLAEALELIGWEAQRRQGDQVRGPCPLHGCSQGRQRRPKSRCFAAHLPKGLWHCFVCGAKGNVLDLWAALTRQPLYAATLDLCQRLGRAVPWREATGTRREQEAIMPP